MKCMICNQEFNSWLSLSIHISQGKHKIKAQDYYDTYLRKENEGICLVCGNETTFMSLSKGYKLFCSVSCAGNDKDVQAKRKQTCIKHFGTEHPLKSKEIQEKIKQTNLEKYGVEHVIQNKEIKQKQEKTMLSRYGVTNPLQSQEIRNKVKKTVKDKYGVDNVAQANEVKDKIKATNIDRYCNACPLQNEIVKEKVKQTMINNYGVDNNFKRKDVRDRANKAAQSEETIKKRNNTYDKLYGGIGWKSNKIKEQALDTKKKNKEIDNRLDENNL